MNHDDLIAMGAKEWRGKDGTQHRFYFNDLARWYGFVDGTPPMVDGKPITDADANALAAAGRDAKVFWNVSTGKLAHYGKDEVSTAIAAKVAARIKDHLGLPQTSTPAPKPTAAPPPPANQPALAKEWEPDDEIPF